MSLYRFLLLLVVLLLSCRLQGNPALNPGEVLTFRVGWGLFVHAGDIRIAARSTPPANQTDRLQVTTTTATRGLAKAIFEFEARAESVYDASSGHLLMTSEATKTPDKETKVSTTFDYAKLTASYTSGKNPGPVLLTMPAGDPQDLIMSLVQTRRWNLKPGEHQDALVIFGDEFYELTIYAERFEEVKTALGTFNTLVLVPRMEKTAPKGMFKRGGAVRVWISQDERRLPVKFQVDFKFGAGVATLSSYEPPEKSSAPAAPVSDAKILVLRGGALGDFIVTLPALASLRQRWPQSRIELAGNSTAAELGREAGLLDAIHSQHEVRWSELYGSRALGAAFAAWLASFELVVNFWPDPEGELRRRFPRHAGRLIFGQAVPTRSPAAAHYCEPLRALGCEPNGFFYALFGKEKPPVQPVVELIHIALHAGSGSPFKNWPIDRWTAVARWIRTDFAAELVVISGEAEIDRGTAAAFSGIGRELKNLPLTRLAAELRACRLFLGHDSGVSHLAAACGVPCVLLFGPTDPMQWAPPASHVRVLQRGTDLESITVPDVCAAVAAALAVRG